MTYNLKNGRMPLINHIATCLAITLAVISIPDLIVAQQSRSSQIKKLEAYGSFHLVKNTRNEDKVGAALSFGLQYAISGKFFFSTSLEGGMRGVEGVNFFAASGLNVMGNLYPLKKSNSFYVGLGIGLQHMNAIDNIFDVDYEGPHYGDIPIKPALHLKAGYWINTNTSVSLAYRRIGMINFTTTRPTGILNINPSHLILSLTYLL